MRCNKILINPIKTKMVSTITDNIFDIKADVGTDDDSDERFKFTKGHDYFMKYILNPKPNKFNEEIILKQTTCKIGGVEQINLEKRNSQTFKWHYIINSQKVNDFLVKNGLYLLDHGVASYCHYDWESYTNYKTKFELIKYEVGGLFNKHRDKLEGQLTDRDIHTHMCLLYPPAYFSPFEGGDIVFYLKNNLGVESEQVIKPSEFTQWTFLIFEQQTMHKVMPVTKGVRYVYKAPLFKKNPHYVVDNYDEDHLES